MRLVAHTVLIVGILLGSDYSVNAGVNTRAVMSDGSPRAILLAAHMRVKRLTESIRRRVGEIVE